MGLCLTKQAYIHHNLVSKPGRDGSSVCMWIVFSGVRSTGRNLEGIKDKKVESLLMDSRLGSESWTGCHWKGLGYKGGV